jgi:hypothetical protein
MEKEVEAQTGKLRTDARKAVCKLCPSVRGLTKDFVAEVADVITQDSEICCTKAWTSGQPAPCASTAGLESLSKCPKFGKKIVAEVADVITQVSKISFTKAWTSGQPALCASTFSNHVVIV